ncbi:MAG TPA: FGGY-family carbohydrate kinase [Verrucomicrobiae bacterium]|nr:FGGY-family carbohydrate kinase [Verrucomicrobiae bacterium]
MSLLSFDIGSSHCKGVLFSDRGEIHAEGTQAYAPEFPEPHFAELSPEVFWSAVCTVSRKLAAHSVSDPVQAISLSSHGETFVPLGANREPLCPAILNIDNRSTSEAAWIADQFGRSQTFQTTGQIVSPIYTLTKILWLHRHRPDLCRATHTYAGVPTYLLVRMNLPPLIDYSLASRYMAFDLHSAHWCAELLALTGLRADLLPTPVPAGTVAGKLNAEIAGILGVPSGTAVVLGGHDQACGALGTGTINAGRTSDSMGTYECILTASTEPHLGDKAFAVGLNTAFHVVPGRFTTLAYFPAGIMLQWFHNLLYGKPANPENSAEESAHFAELEAQASPGPSGLCVTPHLIGTCNPDFNPNARAAISGIFVGASRGLIYKGILEGIACELRNISEDMANAVGDLGDFYAVGGGSRSPIGLQLRASLTGHAFHLLRCQEAVCLGGAILAAVALGIHRDVPAAVSHMVREKEVIEPDPRMAAEYSEQVRKYRALIPALESARKAGTSFLHQGEPS